jgi:hypothetical protein
MIDPCVAQSEISPFCWHCNLECMLCKIAIQLIVIVSKSNNEFGLIDAARDTTQRDYAQRFSPRNYYPEMGGNGVLD